MATIAGLDDAGRGPVIGPMVLAGISIEEKHQKELEKLGVKDSKLIAPNRREELYKQIIKVVKNYKIIVVQAKEIDKAVESESSNLNWLESEKFGMIINHLKPNIAIIDCPSTNLKAYTEHLRRFLKGKTHLICEHKADLNHPVVAAASILAKVTRDKEIEKLKEKYGDLGSGYPSDPKTKKYLEKNWKKYPEIFRKSWASYKKYTSTKQAELGEF